MTTLRAKRTLSGNIALVIFLALVVTLTVGFMPGTAQADPGQISATGTATTVGTDTSATLTITIAPLTEPDAQMNLALMHNGVQVGSVYTSVYAIYNAVYASGGVQPVNNGWQYVYSWSGLNLDYGSNTGYSLVVAGDPSYASIPFTIEGPARPSGGGGGGGGGSDNSSSTTKNVTASSGGTITDTGNGVTLNIPANALAADVKVTIEKVANTASIAPGGQAKFVSDVLEIVKDKSGNFDKPVTISLSYDKSSVDTSKFDLKVCWYNEDTQEWVPLDDITVDSTSGKVSGQVTHFTKFAVIAFPKEAPKPEVKPVDLTDIKGSWAEANIVKLVGMEAIAGYPDGTFKPNDSISRAEFCSVLVKALKLEAKSGKVFNDTAKHWAKDAISTAAAYGIVNGMSDTTFAPDASITREQMAVMIVKAAKVTKTTGGKDFADKAKISSWAKDAVAAATDHQIINGYPDNTFKPQGIATRAEAVTVIVKIIK